MRIPIIFTVMFLCFPLSALADDLSEKALKEFQQSYRREKKQQKKTEQKLRKAERKAARKGFPAKLEKQKSIEAQNKKLFDEQYQRRLKKLSQEKQNKLTQHLQEKQKKIHQERAKIKKEMTNEIGPMYQEAVRAYKAKDYRKAEEMFLEIHQLFPNYKQTEDYLKRMGSRRGTRPAWFDKSIHPDQRRQVVSEALDQIQ